MFQLQSKFPDFYPRQPLLSDLPVPIVFLDNLFLAWTCIKYLRLDVNQPTIQSNHSVTFLMWTFKTHRSLKFKRIISSCLSIVHHVVIGGKYRPIRFGFLKIQNVNLNLLVVWCVHSQPVVEVDIICNDFVLVSICVGIWRYC